MLGCTWPQLPSLAKEADTTSFSYVLDSKAKPCSLLWLKHSSSILLHLYQLVVADGLLHSSRFSLIYFHN